MQLRHCFAAAVVANMWLLKITFLGGYGGIGANGGGLYLDTAEVLNIGSNAVAWEALPPLSCRRAGCGAAIGPCNRLFVLGGGPDGRSQHDSMEALDVREKKWQTDFPRCRIGR